jgi:hypothetical protein
MLSAALRILATTALGGAAGFFGGLFGVGGGAIAIPLLGCYPRLTAEMIRLAPVYAAAYPLRGRPRKQPWHDHKPVHRSRRRLAAIAAP